MPDPSTPTDRWPERAANAAALETDDPVLAMALRVNTRLSVERDVLQAEVESLRAELAPFLVECDKVGIPHDAEALVRHHCGNAGMAGAAEAMAEWAQERRALKADAEAWRRHKTWCPTRPEGPSDDYDDEELPPAEPTCPAGELGPPA